MNLQRRTALSVGIPFLAVAAVLCGIFQQYVLGEFGTIEQARTSDNVKRALRAFNSHQDALQAKAVDWGQWDDTYNFVVDRNQKYVESMLVYDTLSSILVRHILYVDTDLKSVVDREVDQQLQEVHPVPDSVRQAILSLAPLRQLRKAEDKFVGVIRIDQDLLFIVASPILDSKREKDTRGLLILTQPITSAFVTQIADQTKLRLDVVDLQENRLAALEPTQHEALASLSGDEGTYTATPDENTIVGFGALRDVSGVPALLLKVTQPRDVYAQGIAVRNYLVGCLLVTSLIAMLATMVILNRTVILRLTRLGRELTEITQSRDFHRRVKTLGADEFGRLSAEINGMLSSLQSANRDTESALLSAKEASQAKSIFLAKVSHELRTPIHAITGSLQILKKEETSPSKKSFINMARRSAFSLLDTINEILDFSKIETGKLSLESIEFRLRDVVREALYTVAPRAKEKGTLELVFDMERGVPDAFMGDPLRVKQCLINLLGNAIKFTESGYIMLSVRSGKGVDGGTTLLISVRDSGVGIPADRIERIFDPFTQADDSISRVYAGTGLGLTIVKQLVEQMGGRVDVVSEVDKGTEFTLTIPLPEVGGAVWEEASFDFTPKKIAIVDRSSYAVSVWEKSFTQYGVESAVVLASDAQSMSALTENLEKFGLVLVSSSAISLPHVTQFVAEMSSTKRIPVAVIVSPFDITVRERVAALDVPWTVIEPVSVEDILLSIAGKLDLEAAASEDNEEAVLASDKKLRVLVADDAETNRIILSNLLEGAGHEVICVENGAELIAALTDQISGKAGTSPFDIVLTDVQMPVMDGLTATQKIRSLEGECGGTRHIPIVAVTAHALVEEKMHMKECGVDDVVTKPILPAELARVLTELGGAVPASQPVNTQVIVPVEVTEVDQLRGLALSEWQKLRLEEGVVDFDSLDGELPFEQILDTSDVYNRSGDSLRRTRLIFNAFVSSYSDPLEKLSQAKAECDVLALKGASHALKGLLLDIGAKTTGKVAAIIEDHCKAGKFDEAVTFVDNLSNQVLTVGKLAERVIAVIPVPAKKPVADGQGEARA